jgi:hypothetical protein
MRKKPESSRKDKVTSKDLKKLKLPKREVYLMMDKNDLYKLNQETDYIIAIEEIEEADYMDSIKEDYDDKSLKEKKDYLNKFGVLTEFENDRYDEKPWHYDHDVERTAEIIRDTNMTELKRIISNTKDERLKQYMKQKYEKLRRKYGY